MIKYKLRFRFLFLDWIIYGRGVHKVFKLLELPKAIKEIDRYNSNTTIYCPKCDNELIHSDSHTGSGLMGIQDGFEFYKCSNCKHESRWDFDCIVPILLND